jgi:(p)ppGpp synthase/HD superfamily hydrolase
MAPVVDTERARKMRELIERAHADQTRNGGRVRYAVHCLSVGSILSDAIGEAGELDEDPSLAEDIVIAGYGHDLYEDTDVGPAEIRDRFGPRVDQLIESVTNRRGDHDQAGYFEKLRQAGDATRLIKLADLTDNVASCAYGIHDLETDWIGGFMVPTATKTIAAVTAASYSRLSRTAALIERWFRFSMRRLATNFESARPARPAKP